MWQVSFSFLYAEYIVMFVADKFSYLDFTQHHVTHSSWSFLMLYNIICNVCARNEENQCFLCYMQMLRGLEMQKATEGV